MSKFTHAGGPLLVGVALFFMLFQPAVGNELPLERVAFAGELPVKEADALDAVNLTVGTVITRSVAQKAAEELQKVCREAYHPLATVEWTVRPSSRQNSAILIFTCKPGPKGRLEEVRIRGARVFSEEVILGRLKTLPREGNWNRLLKKDRLKLADLNRDRESIIEWYHRHGYVAVDVGASILEKPPGRQGFRLTWPILKEGPRYSIGAISFRAERLPREQILNELIPFEPGDVYDARAIRAARWDFERFLQNNGYAFSSVEIELQRVDSDARVDVEFVVEVGKQPRLRDISIRGNQRTKDHVILRDISLEPGMMFDAQLLEIDLAELNSLPMFSRVTMDYGGDLNSEEFDLIVEVEEKLSGRLEAGVAYGEVEEAALQINLFESNLSLKPPFRGDGMLGRLSATVGSRIRRFDAEISNPRFRDTFWSLQGIVFAEDSEYVNDNYNQRSLNGQLIAGYPIARGQMVSVGLGANLYEIYDIEELVEEDLDPDEERVNLTSVLTAWSLDRTDQWLRPTEGFRVRLDLDLGTELLGGDTDLLQANFRAAGFYSPYRDHVLSLRGEVESMQPFGSTDDVPLAVRTFLGGSKNLRGFEYRSVSPVEENGTLLGGASAWWASLEYMFPVLPKLELAVYYDIGDIGNDSFSVSGVGPVSDVGIGFLVRADNFPARFDIAAPIEVVEGDPINEEGDLYISFSAGYRFY